jgi:hypothetical protein
LLFDDTAFAAADDDEGPGGGHGQGKGAKGAVRVGAVEAAAAKAVEGRCLESLLRTKVVQNLSLSLSLSLSLPRKPAAHQGSEQRYRRPSCSYRDLTSSVSISSPGTGLSEGRVRAVRRALRRLRARRQARDRHRGTGDAPDPFSNPLCVCVL